MDKTCIQMSQLMSLLTQKACGNLEEHTGIFQSPFSVFQHANTASSLKWSLLNGCLCMCHMEWVCDPRSEFAVTVMEMMMIISRLFPYVNRALQIPSRHCGGMPEYVKTGMVKIHAGWHYESMEPSNKGTMSSLPRERKQNLTLQGRRNGRSSKFRAPHKIGVELLIMRRMNRHTMSVGRLGGQPCPANVRVVI